MNGSNSAKKEGEMPEARKDYRALNSPETSIETG
jgi:hypothetical protein